MSKAKLATAKSIYRRDTLPDHVQLPFRPVSTSAPIAFATFGAHRPRYRTAAVNLAEEAAASGWFNRVFLQADERLAVTSPTIEQMETAWIDADRAFIRDNPKGYGYWLWKPLLLRQLLARLDEGTLLVYADGGCELSQQGGPRLQEYLRMAEETGGLFFSLPFSEAEYSKREFLDHVTATPAETESKQIQGTILILHNRAAVRDFVDKWIELCRTKNYSLLTDALDPAIQAPGFRVHRHDQAILSLLVKRSGFAVLPWEDNFDKVLYWIVNSWVYLFPIHARRAQRRRLAWRVSGLSSMQGCVASAHRSIAFRLQHALFSILTLKFLKRD